jgi:hypothetical protein
MSEPYIKVKLKKKKTNLESWKGKLERKGGKESWKGKERETKKSSESLFYSP